MNLYYEIILIEKEQYYINFYAVGREYPPIKLKLDTNSYKKWKVGKIEI